MRDHGYWIDPNGEIYSVGACGHADFARQELISEGLSQRAIERISDPEDILLDRGWVRVSVTGVWILRRELAPCQVDALWDLAGQLNGVDDVMARRVMRAIREEGSVFL